VRGDARERSQALAPAAPAGTFKLTLTFTEDYPNKAPTVRFESKMFHPNSAPGRALRDSSFLLQTDAARPSLRGRRHLLRHPPEPVESDLRRLGGAHIHPVTALRPESKLASQLGGGAHVHREPARLRQARQSNRRAVLEPRRSCSRRRLLGRWLCAGGLIDNRANLVGFKLCATVHCPLSLRLLLARPPTFHVVAWTPAPPPPPPRRHNELHCRHCRLSSPCPSDPMSLKSSPVLTGRGRQSVSDARPCTCATPPPLRRASRRALLTVATKSSEVAAKQRR